MSVQSVLFSEHHNVDWGRRLYDRSDVVVTHRWFHAGGHHYHIADLRNVVKARRATHVGVTVAMLIAIVEALLIIPVLAAMGPASASPIALLALVVPTAVAAVCAKRRPPRWELRAIYRGLEVCLFGGTDRKEFEEVARALRRAIEAIPSRVL